VIVVIELARRRLILKLLLYTWIVRKENVRPSIAIVVDQYNASTHRLDDVLLLRHKIVAKADATLRNDILKLWNRTTRTCHSLRARRHNIWRMTLLRQREASETEKEKYKAMAHELSISSEAFAAD